MKHEDQEAEQPQEFGFLPYNVSMKAKPQSEEYKAFEHLLGKVLTVSKTELNLRMKKAEHEKHTPTSASRASDAQAKRT